MFRPPRRIAVVDVLIARQEGQRDPDALRRVKLHSLFGQRVLDNVRFLVPSRFGGPPPARLKYRR